MGQKIAPIKPDQIPALQEVAIPDVVIEVFNALIAKNYRSGYSSFLQDDAVAELMKKGLNKKDIYANNWLDIEEIYRKNGWKVEYDRPAYCESYPASFNFSKKRD